eukprot:g9673.t1
MGNCGAKTKVIEDETEALPSELTLKKKAELQTVLDADGIKQEEGDAWYIVEAAWVQRWLAFVQGDDSVKRPGPIKNENLLIRDPESDTWVPKPLLRAARREHMGHYRRVNPHVWNMWTGTYRGSGPAIWVVTEPFEDSSNWQLDREFTGSSRGQSGVEGPSGAADASMQQPAYTLAIGEMEDDGVGEETAAKAAAFFDVALDSPRVSARGAASPRAVGSSNGSGAGGGGRAGSLPRGPGSSGGANGETSRQPTAAEMWMYGSADGGSGAPRME